MEVFQGRTHLPGAAQEWNIELEVDWAEKETTVRIHEAPDGLTEWPG